MYFAGKIIFLIGLLTSLFAGFYYYEVNLTSFLFLLGAIVGFLNISLRERTSFLISVSALLLIGLAGFRFYYMEREIQAALGNIMIFSSGAVIVVAIRQVFDLGKD